MESQQITSQTKHTFSPSELKVCFSGLSFEKCKIDSFPSLMWYYYVLGKCVCVWCVCVIKKCIVSVAWHLKASGSFHLYVVQVCKANRLNWAVWVLFPMVYLYHRITPECWAFPEVSSFLWYESERRDLGNRSSLERGFLWHHRTQTLAEDLQVDSSSKSNDIEKLLNYIVL